MAVEAPGGLQRLPLEQAGGGYFLGTHPVTVGTRYRFCLEGGDFLPDPCSRFQPEGPHGPSQVVDPSSFRWTDQAWRGLGPRGQVLYELHVGTFSAEGTYAGLRTHLPHLVELGVTALELMPLNTCPGRFNWGYDGVSLFAPTPAYGTPEQLRALVDEAHRLGLGVLVDVVYNHLGPDGNYLGRYAQAYFTDRYRNDWGQALNFEGPTGRPVREFFLQNVRMWIAEYHCDGLRFDATQNLNDASPRHLLTELIAEARSAAGERQVLIVSENEPQDRRLVQSEGQGGNGGDLLWVDDFHHSARVALTGNAEAYCQDYRGSSQELLSCVLRNSLYQGQHYQWQQQGRGTPLMDQPAERAVFFLQNHDQLANTLRGRRLGQLAGEDLARAITLYFLLLPQTPMLFQGQEFFASSPFLFFVDHNAELMPLIQRGRDQFLSQFGSARRALEQEGHQVPIGAPAFERSRLDWSEREKHDRIFRLHQEALRLRREDPLLAAQELDLLAGATLTPQALVLRWQGWRWEKAGGAPAGDRLLVLNLGADTRLSPAPEPLLAPVPGHPWRLLLSSQHTRFGGMGACAPGGDGPWTLPGHCALLLTSQEASP